MLTFSITPWAKDAYTHAGREPAINDIVGWLPSFFWPEDPRSAEEQLDTSYAHGGGFKPFEGFKVTEDLMSIRYPGDPPLHAVATAWLHDQQLILYQGAWLGIFTPGKAPQICRVD